MNLQIDSLSKSYRALRGSVHGVRNVTLAVEEGEFFVLLGPSGCGKSTLLNLVAGLEKPTTGEIRFGERVMASSHRRIFVPPGKRNVAMVFQNYALYPHMSVAENIAFPLKVARESGKRIGQEVERVSALLGIQELLGRRPGELSGGQRQRVAIARAIIRRPQLFLLDEPLSNLDAQLRNSTRIELKRLQRELGVTTLYVTHDQTEAMTLADRVALFREGSPVQVGSPWELYENPRTPFVARFIGMFPMNLMEGQLLHQKNLAILSKGNEEVTLPSRGLPAELWRRDFVQITAGFRPEHGNIVRVREGAIRGEIVGLEPLGREALVHVASQWGELLVLVQGNGAKYRSGDEVSVEIDVSRMHFFHEGVRVQ